MNDSTTGKLIAATLALTAIILVTLSIYWDEEPAAFNVPDQTMATSEQFKRPVVVGSATTATLMHMVQVMFDKRGGYLANDVLPPGLLMDNMPQWEYGVMLQVRDMTRVMHNKITQSGFVSTEDEDIALAEVRFDSVHTSWIMPDVQTEYQEGIQHLGQYLLRLSDPEDPEATFDASADNLNDWLGAVEVRLNSLSARLIGSVGQKAITTGVASDQEAEDGEAVKTPWLEIDDVFYEARGTSWALIHLLKAVQMDFSEVLKDKKAEVNIAQIIRELESTQQDSGSPMVLNGDVFGLLANHSLVMVAYISRANAEIIQLRKLLEKE
jgi:hypothetical protein